jgi:hypothetical protein
MNYRPLFINANVPPKCITVGCRKISRSPGTQCEVCDVLDSMCVALDKLTKSN